MIEQVATLEILNSSFRVVVGYMYEDKVDIIYRNTFPLTTPINDADIIDYESLANDLTILAHLEENKLKLSINEVILIYHPFGLDVYSTSKVTNTISEDSRITSLDIANCLSIIKKERIPNQNNILIDVIPSLFTIDNNKQYIEPPLNEISQTLSIKSNIYTLPSKMKDDIYKALDIARIKVKKEVIAPVGVSYLLTSLNYIPLHYLLIDFSEKDTLVSLISQRNVIASSFFPIGLDHLDEKISASFKIGLKESKDIRKLYGLNFRKNEFNKDIIKDKNSLINKGYNKDNLNEIIVGFLKEWVTYLKNAISTLVGNNEDMINRFALAFLGTGAELKGFKEYIERFFNVASIDILKSNTIGAIEPSWISSLGAIYFSSIYKGSLIDSYKSKVNDINREIEDKEYSEIDDRL